VEDEQRPAVAALLVVQRHARALDLRHPCERTAPARYDEWMEGFGGLFGDPEELSKKMAEFAEQMQAQQGLVWADNAIKLAVEMTVAAINRVNIQGTVEQQAEQIRSVMATVFPDAVALVREARSGLQ
jgi:hypothetical protein